MSLLFLCGGCDQNARNPSTAAASTAQTLDTPSASGTAAPQSVDNPFPSAKSVRLFVEAGYAKDGSPIFSKPAGRILTSGERADFEATLRMIKMPDDLIGCFIPHHFFRYYDDRGKQVGEIEVCFCCSGVRATGAPALQEHPTRMLSANYAAMEKLVHRLGEATDVDCH